MDIRKNKVIGLLNDTGYDLVDHIEMTDENIKILYDLFVDNVEPDADINLDICKCIAWYYDSICESYKFRTYSYDKKYYKLAKKYFLLAISKGDIGCMFELASLYKMNYNIEKASKYYKMAIDNGFNIDDIDFDSYNKHKPFDNNFYLSKNMLELYIEENKELKKENKMLKTMVEIQPGGHGYEETKKHFEENC